MSTLRRKHHFASLVFNLILTSTLFAQTPSPNADILKMIQAGLPESVIIDKITAGTGHWDVSVDALIVLKQAGATPAEMKAMTAPLAAPAPVATTVPLAQPQGPQIAGGTLRNTAAGDPYIQFPEAIQTLFPDGTKSNRAFLVSYEGKPAIRISAAHLRRTLDNAEVSGNLLLTEETVLFDPYLAEEHLGAYPKNGRYVEKHDGAIHEDGFSIPRNKVNLNYEKLTYYNNNFPSPRATSFSGNRHYNVGWHFSSDSNNNNRCGEVPLCMSSELEDFVRGLVHDFGGTMAPLLAAAGITDADKQLSPDAHYHLLTKDDYPKIAAIYQRQLDGRSAPTKEHNGLADLAEITQIASAGATALAQSNAGGNTIAAQQAAMAQYNQNVAAIESGGTPNLTPAPTTATPSASTPQDALNQQLGNIKAAAPSAKAAAGSAAPKNLTFNENLPNGDIRKSTTTGVQGAYTITIQCFTHNGSAPYFTYSRSGPSDFFFNLPPCSGSPTVASAPAPSPPSDTVAPPIPYQKPPSTGGTVVSSGAVCPASGYIFTSHGGDAATGVPCTPGQPVSLAGGGSSGSSSGSGTAGASGDFVTGLDRCISESFTLISPGDTVPFLTFTNGCSQPVYVSWIVGRSGSPRGHSFAVGESFNQTGSDQNDVHNEGGVTFYACPTDHPVAVDSKGNQIFGPITPYKCAKRS